MSVLVHVEGSPVAQKTIQLCLWLAYTTWDLKESDVCEETGENGL